METWRIWTSDVRYEGPIMEMEDEASIQSDGQRIMGNGKLKPSRARLSHRLMNNKHKLM